MMHRQSPLVNSVNNVEFVFIKHYVAYITFNVRT